MHFANSAPLLLLLAACSGNTGDAEADDYAVRVSLDSTSPEGFPAAGAPEQPDDAAWRESAGGAVSFGAGGEDPLLTLSCEDGALGATRIAITRHWPAPTGAGALLALVGNLRLRVPVDADGSESWTGSLPSNDERWRILEDGFTATLPGGGLLRMPATPLLTVLLRECRDRAAPPPDTSALEKS